MVFIQGEGVTRRGSRQTAGASREAHVVRPTAAQAFDLLTTPPRAPVSPTPNAPTPHALAPTPSGTTLRLNGDKRSDEKHAADTSSEADPEAVLSRLLRHHDPEQESSPRTPDAASNRHATQLAPPATPPSAPRVDAPPHPIPPPKTSSPHPNVAEFLAEVESRLPGRIRELSVACREDGSLVLHGACSSYYVKQLAQHIGMNLMASGRLINQIKVAAPR